MEEEEEERFLYGIKDALTPTRQAKISLTRVGEELNEFLNCFIGADWRTSLSNDAHTSYNSYQQVQLIIQRRVIPDVIQSESCLEAWSAILQFAGKGKVDSLFERIMIILKKEENAVYMTAISKKYEKGGVLDTRRLKEKLELIVQASRRNLSEYEERQRKTKQKQEQESEIRRTMVLTHLWPNIDGRSVDMAINQQKLIG